MRIRHSCPLCRRSRPASAVSPPLHSGGADRRGRRPDPGRGHHRRHEHGGRAGHRPYGDRPVEGWAAAPAARSPRRWGGPGERSALANRIQRIGGGRTASWSPGPWIPRGAVTHASTPPFRYHRPDTMQDAVSLLAEYAESAIPVSGGTDLIPNMKHRLFTPAHLVALKGIESSRGSVRRTGSWSSAPPRRSQTYRCILQSDFTLQRCPRRRGASLGPSSGLRHPGRQPLPRQPLRRRRHLEHHPGAGGDRHADPDAASRARATHGLRQAPSAPVHRLSAAHGSRSGRRGP